MDVDAIPYLEITQCPFDDAVFSCSGVSPLPHLFFPFTKPKKKQQSSDACWAINAEAGNLATDSPDLSWKAIFHSQFCSFVPARVIEKGDAGSVPGFHVLPTTSS